MRVAHLGLSVGENDLRLLLMPDNVSASSSSELVNGNTTRSIALTSTTPEHRGTSLAVATESRTR